MKTNKLIVALALPLAFAACSNEEIIESQSSPVVGANLVEVDALAVDLGGAESRGLWEIGTGELNWSWIPELNAAGESVISSNNVYADQIGLCWTGELADGTGSISSKVYSNYQFLHFGWLRAGVSSASFDPCKVAGQTGYIKNGVQYNEVTTSITGSETVSGLKDKLAATTYNTADGATSKKLNLATGVFKTDNKAIFGGSYIVYFPYNPSFADAASLPATSTTEFTNVPVGDLETEHMYKNTFMVGYAKNLVGGSQASKLSLDPLSSVVSIQLKAKTANDDIAFNGKNITKIALWSEDGFVKSVALNASKVKANGALAGEKLYVEGTKVTSNTIVATLATAATIGESNPYKDPTKIYLPLLPTTAKNLKAILYRNDGLTAVVSLGDEFKFEAGKGTIVSVPLAHTDFTNAKIAVDQITLEAAENSTASSIVIAGDITLTSDLMIDRPVKISGDDIIVPATKTMTVVGSGSNPYYANIESNIIIESKGCCKSADGKLIAKDYSVFKNIDNHGDVEVSGSARFNGSITNHSDGYGTPEIKVTAAGTMNLYGTLANEEAVVNYGNFEMKAGSKVENDGLIENRKLFTNHSSQANFQNNDTYVDMLGGYLNGNLLTNNDDYICEVNNDATRMDYALIQRSMVTTVRFVGDGWHDFSKYSAMDFSDLKFVVSSASSVGFLGGKKVTDAEGVVSYVPMELKIKSLSVNSTLLINSVGINNHDVTANNNKLSLKVKEDVLINAGGNLSFNQPILASIGKSLKTTNTYGSSLFNPTNGAMIEIGNKYANDGTMYISSNGKAQIGNAVKINVYGNVDKSIYGAFLYDSATSSSVSGEVRCKTYNGSAAWTPGHAPAVDVFFVFE